MLCHLLTKIVSLCAIFYMSPHETIGVSFLNNNQNITLVNDQDYLSCFTTQPIVLGPHLYIIDDNNHIIHNEDAMITLPKKDTGSKKKRQIIKVKEKHNFLRSRNLRSSNNFLRSRNLRSRQYTQKLIKNLKTINELIKTISKSKEKIDPK